MNRMKFRVYRQRTQNPSVTYVWTVRRPGCNAEAFGCVHYRCSNFVHHEDATDFCRRQAANHAFLNPRFCRSLRKSSYALVHA